MKKILFLIMLFLIVDKAFADYSFTTTEYDYLPQQQYYQRYPVQPMYYSNSGNFNNRSFNNLERKILNQSYKNETSLQRLNRMEEAMFGAVQTGDTNTRYRALQKALAKADYQNAGYPNTVYPNKQGFWNNVLNSFSYNAGIPTGFTPPITNGYYDNNYGYQDNYYDNFGNYRNNAYNYQNGSRVRILD